MGGTVGVGGVFAVVALLVTVVAAIRGIWSPCGLSMISAINPISERSRGHRFALTACWFIGGAVVGGALLGAVAAAGAALWSLLPVGAAVTAGIGALCCLLTLASDTAVTGFRLPEHPRQVNERWLGRYRRWVYAAGFGVQIGAGFATYIMTAAVYLAAALAVLSGQPAFALAVGVLFGLVRGAAVLLSSRVRDPGGLRRLHRRLDLLGPWSLRVAIAVQAVAAICLGGVAGGIVGVAVAVLLLLALVLVAARGPRPGVAGSSTTTTGSGAPAAHR